jgi:hypothetical protein
MDDRLRNVRTGGRHPVDDQVQVLRGLVFGSSSPGARYGDGISNSLIAAVADVAHPTWRAFAVGAYRLWRDDGYAIGALLAGILADLPGIRWAIGVVGRLTFLSGLIVTIAMYEPINQRSGE